MKLVLAGVGDSCDFFEKNIIQKYDEIYVFDNYKKDEIICGHKKISFEEIKKNKGNFNVVIVANALESTYELCRQFRGGGIKHDVYSKERLINDVLHIEGSIDNLKYEWIGLGTYSIINKQMEEMFNKVFCIYHDDFKNTNINIFFYIEDMPQKAYKIAEICGIKYIFALCTVFPVSDRVIPIPNYFSCFDENNFPWTGSNNSELKIASKEKWLYPQAVWKGDLKNTPDELRKMLFLLGEKNPDFLRIERYDDFWAQFNDNSFTSKFTPMTELAKYKYLIDIRGWSFFARFTRLMKLGRVVLRVNSIYKEWYDDYLIPMKHYVPVKGDMSDLIDKIKWLDNNPQIYEEIVRNARDFSKNYFSTEKYIEYLKDAVMKYGCE